MTNNKVSGKNFAKKILLVFGILALGLGGLTTGLYLPGITASIKNTVLADKNKNSEIKIQKIAETVTPDEGFTLPVSWGDLGPKLVELGVIDEDKFKSAVNMTDEQQNILLKGSSDPVKINKDNGQFVVDLLWGIGLAQKTSIYTDGPLGNEYKNDQGSFASTGGWTLAKGDPLRYLGKFDLIPLSDAQHARVSEISKNVYRPCCNNPTWFPDCNHGMAALAAIEMMVSKDMSDDDIYKNVLKLNSFWFSDSYLSVAVYFDNQGVKWENVDAKKVLGAEYSSSTGASNISSKVGPLPGRAVSGSCGA